MGQVSGSKYHIGEKVLIKGIISSIELMDEKDTSEGVQYEVYLPGRNQTIGYVTEEELS